MAEDNRRHAVQGDADAKSPLLSGIAPLRERAIRRTVDKRFLLAFLLLFLVMFFGLPPLIAFSLLCSLILVAAGVFMLAALLYIAVNPRP